VLAAVSLARLGSFEGGEDLAAYTQATWLLSEGFQPEASLLRDGVHILELHWSFILYPVAGLALIFPTAKMLVVAQAVALGLAVFPLWWLARRVANLRVAAASALVLAYALHPATHRLAIDNFHPEVLAVPAMLAIAYFGASKRWFGYWICVVIVLRVGPISASPLACGDSFSSVTASAGPASGRSEWASFGASVSCWWCNRSSVRPL